MPNGQYHGKTKGHGIRIKNPLPLSVWVHINDGKGFYITRTVRPNSEIYVTVPHLGEYDINPKILQYDHAGVSKELGDGSWESTSTVALNPKVNLQPGPILISEHREVNSRRWVTVAEWLIKREFKGRLMAISIQLNGDCEAQVLIPKVKPLDITIAPQLSHFDRIITYQNNLWLKEGDAVRVKARSHIGNAGDINVMIQGEIYLVEVPKGVPNHVTEGKSKEEPEEPLRSLGEMIDDMKREEVRV